MNRRGFLGILAGAIASTAIGIKLASAPPKLGAVLFGVDPFSKYPALDSVFGLDDFEQRILNPAMQRIAEQVDAQMNHYADLEFMKGNVWSPTVPRVINIEQPVHHIDFKRNY
jgi:hypothetical protein